MSKAVRFSFLLSLLMASARLSAQTPDSLRSFNAQALEAYRRDPSFAYEVASEGSHWLARLWLSFLSLLSRIFSVSADGVQLWQLLVYILLIAILLFVILRLFGIETSGFLGRSPKGTRVTAGPSAEEDIHALNFEEEFSKAEVEQNFQRLIRLYYLAALKLLTDRGRIRWQPGKTNHQYLSELKEASHQQALERLGYYFEYAWYGNFPVGETQVISARKHYQHLKITAA